MLWDIILFIFVPFLLLVNPQSNEVSPIVSKEFSLNNRYANEYVNGVFRDNILLTIDYLSGAQKTKDVNWQEVNKPFKTTLTLKRGEVFAFHDDVLPKYANVVSKTTNAHFNASEGFKFSGKLFGDGVCHLASFIYWAAKDAGLDTYAPVRHDFAKIPDVPREYGVSIFATPGKNQKDQMQNLYITNNRKNDVEFVFDYDGENLKINVVESRKIASLLGE